MQLLIEYLENIVREVCISGASFYFASCVRAVLCCAGTGACLRREHRLISKQQFPEAHFFPIPM